MSLKCYDFKAMFVLDLSNRTYSLPQSDSSGTFLSGVSYRASTEKLRTRYDRWFEPKPLLIRSDLTGPRLDDYIALRALRV